MVAELSWTSWEQMWKDCVKCPIGSLAHRHVLGTGPRTAKVLLVGEGPGRSEDVLGLPFVGRAGKLLDQMLVESGLYRSSVFISNLVACRPCDDRHGDNRPPTVVEVKNCESRLKTLVHLLKPRVVVLVGRTAQAYAHDMLNEMNYPGRVLYLTHPAAFLRQGGPKAPGYAKAVADLASIKTHG